ncbi:MAG: hypothetical protein A2Y10_17445 [Planctomycetes bacterium GWF2_41_51]|nr:MAG: hypothetical protein A2Y10_17445 [Planctomycetes bacterium GWF2_41_51]HBG28012.1 hypothetical protein [Phycisphaerales bacterium]
MAISKMEVRQRFHKVMNFEPVDRLPLFEFASWWDKTIERWRREGLPDNYKDIGEINDYLGLDKFRQFWIRPYTPDIPKVEHGHPLINNIDEYKKIKTFLYPPSCNLTSSDIEKLKNYAILQEQNKMVFWATIEGFFWFPRRLLGIENHLYAYYDNPELINKICQEVLAFNLMAIEKISKICKPDFITLAEDMSYNNGPMISKDIFEQFLAPYYIPLCKKLKESDIMIIVDSDGYVDDMIDWLLNVGVDGITPLEANAGGDVVKLRKKFPNLLMIGNFNKLIMKEGRDAMVKEFERLLPVMKRGGFVPSVDHQTPPDVSLNNYYLYLELLNEYSVRAVNKQR